MLSAAVFAAVTKPRLADRRGENQITYAKDSPLPGLESPFSLTSALKFGIIFLLLKIAGGLAQHLAGHPASMPSA
jgi:uncharacterized membrane protein (DUF4010 family)